MNIPYYRILEMNKIYEVFYDEENKLSVSSNFIDLNERKKKLKKIIKIKYKWLNDIEYNNFYKSIKQKEIDLYLKLKKKEISSKYKDKIIKLFCDGDISNYEEIKQMFEDADRNSDGDLSIDEFIDYLTLNNGLLEKLDEIIECKFEIKRRLDKRNLLFKNFPGSPLKSIGSWRPSLANLRSLKSINMEI